MIRSWWQLCTFVVGGAFCGAVAAGIAFWGNPSSAQIIPDSTLPVNSHIPPNSTTSKIVIDGGTTAKPSNNLFHSFTQFSVPAGGTAYFNNTLDIRNIFIRVTGGNISKIYGTLQANGTANLFLLNPNGIIFGKDAHLNIGGSFVGTTANALGFGNQGFFSATSTNTHPLLTVDPSIFVFNQQTAQPITNKSNLGVLQGRSLLLLGGNVNLKGGQLLAPGGRVELGGIAGAGTVELTVDGNNLRLSYPEGVHRADVLLYNGADVNVKAGGGGTIVINAYKFTMDGSTLEAGIKQGNTSPGSQAGNIDINATGEITLGNKSVITNLVDSQTIVLPTIGNGGDINITAEKLNLSDGANLNASTGGTGNAGNVNINVRDTVSFDGVSKDYNSGAFSKVDPTGVGNGGAVNITTGSLIVTNGASVSTSTTGHGNAGNVNIHARDVYFEGKSDDTGTATGNNPSGVFSAVGRVYIPAVGNGGNINIPAVGNGGNIDIVAESLYLNNGAALVAGTIGMGNGGKISVEVKESINLANASSINSAVGPGGIGNGGNIIIKARSLSTTDSAVFTSVLGPQPGFEGGRGNGGNIQVIANDSINLVSSSKVPIFLINPLNPSQRINTNEFFRGLIANNEANTIGSAGNIMITTGTFQVQERAVVNAETFNANPGGNITINSNTFQALNGGQLTANSQGTGGAGNLIITTRDFRLDNGKITATTQEGDRGNITVQAKNIDLLNASQIATNASKNANGGNININTEVIAALENSAITANAVKGKGGNIEINTQAIFSSRDSKITASSELGIDGLVKINTPGIDPTRGLVVLPTTPEVPVVADACQAVGESRLRGTRVSSFYGNIGRAGLIPNPSEALINSSLLSVPPTLAPGTQTPLYPVTSPQNENSKIVEAQGWVKDKDPDKVRLVPQLPTDSSSQPGAMLNGCN